MSGSTAVAPQLGARTAIAAEIGSVGRTNVNLYAPLGRTRAEAAVERHKDQLVSIVNGFGACLVPQFALKGIGKDDPDYQWCQAVAGRARREYNHLSTGGRRPNCVGCDKPHTSSHLDQNAKEGPLARCIPCNVRYRRVLSRIELL